MQPKAHPAFGAAAAGVAASILAFDLPYYAIAATTALIGLFAVWLTLAVRGVRRRSASSAPGRL